MRKRLTESEYQRAIQGQNFGPRTLEIAHAVLVEGHPQAQFIESLGITNGAVSQAVKRVWTAAQNQIPTGFEKITAVLPVDKAKMVKEWDLQARKELAERL